MSSLDPPPFSPFTLARGSGWRTHLVKNDLLFCVTDEVGDVVGCGRKASDASMVEGVGERDPCACA